MNSFVTKMLMLFVTGMLIIIFFHWVQWNNGGRYNNTTVDPRPAPSCGMETFCEDREPK